MPDLHDLELLLTSPTPVVVIETHEERRVVELFESIAIRIGQPVFTWKVTEGLRRVDIDFEAKADTREPSDLLAAINGATTPGIFVLSDFHPYLDDPVHVRFLKDIALSKPDSGHTVVLVSHALEIPQEIDRLCARFELSMPGREQTRKLVLAEAHAWSRRNRGQNVRSSRRMLDRLVENLMGLPASDVSRLARGAIEDDGAVTESDLPVVMRAKFQALGQDGVLSYECDTAHFADVGGLAALKRWLEVRESVFTGAIERRGLDRPRGIMLLGVQGCGKSLAAKAVAGAWGVPLLRLDFGALYNKFYGETERNLRESLAQAEVMEPCVLWIDEIEKGVSTDASDSGISRRVLGTLLTWMAENTTRVFIVATANDIESLPPELLRKGRLDEIFFVDLPDAETRQTIARIHLDKREIPPGSIDIEQVAHACEGFSGSEIEQAVVSALYASFASGERLDTALLVEEIRRTRPLSVVMAEGVNRLRGWAAGRTVPAN